MATETVVKGLTYAVRGDADITVYDAATGGELAKVKAGKVDTFPAFGDKVRIETSGAYQLTALRTFNAAPAGSGGGLSEESLAELDSRFAPAAHATDTTVHITTEERRELWGQQVEDVIHWSDTSLDTVYSQNFDGNGTYCTGFEEPVERDGLLWALYLPKKKQENDGWGSVCTRYCVFTSFAKDDSIIGTTRGDFVIDLQGARVEFETPLAVVRGGRILFEYYTYFPEGDEMYALAVGLSYDIMFDGWLVEKSGAKVLAVPPSPATPGDGREDMPDLTVFRTLYIKAPSQIEAHASDATAHMTAEEHAGLTELLAKKDALLALLNS